MPPSPDPPRSTARSDVFEALVVEALRRLDVGGEAALAAFCAEHGEHAEERRTAITRLRDSGLLADPRDVAGRGIPERVGEFRLIERIGGGGMGVVYAAIQEPLGRQVAVKLMRPEHVYFDDSHARFRREVEAVARLAHPGIVAIHTVGDAGGLPYYAMEFVEGRSLAQVLRELKDRPPEDLTAQDLGGRRRGSGGGVGRDGGAHRARRRAGARARARARGAAPGREAVERDAHTRARGAARRLRAGGGGGRGAAHALGGTARVVALHGA
jgi:hypothetical protein